MFLHPPEHPGVIAQFAGQGPYLLEYTGTTGGQVPISASARRVLEFLDREYAAQRFDRAFDLWIDGEFLT